MIVTIDSKGFNFRVLKYTHLLYSWFGIIRGENGSDKICPCVHYVAPSTWATKSGMAAYKRDRLAIGNVVNSITMY